MYRVIKYFTDLHDNEYEYHVGDTFPRKGIKVTKERLTELSTKENLQGGTPDRTGRRAGRRKEPEESGYVHKVGGRYD